MGCVEPNGLLWNGTVTGVRACGVPERSIFTSLDYDAGGADIRPEELPAEADSWLYMEVGDISTAAGDIGVLASTSDRSEASEVVAASIVDGDEKLVPLKVLRILATNEAVDAAIRLGVPMHGQVPPSVRNDFAELLGIDDLL